MFQTLGASFPPFENYKDWIRIFLVYDNSQLPSLLPLEAIACISKLQPVAAVCFGKNLPAPLKQAGPVSLRNKARYLPVTHFPLLFPVPASHASAWALLLPRAQAGHYSVHYGFYYWWLLVTEQRNLSLPQLWPGFPGRREEQLGSQWIAYSFLPCEIKIMIAPAFWSSGEN